MPVVYPKDKETQLAATNLLSEINKHDYAYFWDWLGVPIIQQPEDIVHAQELIFQTQPDVIIETGIAWGGSTLFYASILELIGNGQVISIDRNIPDIVRTNLSRHRFSNRITLLEGDSINSEVHSSIRGHIPSGSKVSVFLDSDHSHDHVLAELLMFSEYVTKGNHITVYATAIEHLAEPIHRRRAWGKGNNPWTALEAFLSMSQDYEIDEKINAKSILGFAPLGRLKRMR